MGKLAIINGSPRLSKSNSKIFSDCFRECYHSEVIEFFIFKDAHEDICSKLDTCSDILFVFPLYVDTIPAKLLDFLKYLEKYSIEHKPRVNVIINCGFLEYEQNEVAIEVIKLFCEQNNYTFASYLSIGSGEPIMGTPFAFMVRSKIKKLAKAMERKDTASLFVRMPLTKKMYVSASTKSWIKHAKEHGVTEEELRIMSIES